MVQLLQFIVAQAKIFRTAFYAVETLISIDIHARFLKFHAICIMHTRFRVFFKCNFAIENKTSNIITNSFVL